MYTSKMASREELEEQIRVLQRQLALQISSDDRSNGSTAIPSSTNIQVDANPQVPFKSTAVISLPSPVVSVTLKANQLTQQSFGPAFDLCKSAQDLKILHLVPPPGLLDGDNWLSESDVDKEVSLQGIMYNYRLEKGRIKGQKKINSHNERIVCIELIPADTESASKACAIVMECGVGSSAFQTILNTLKECDKNEENMMLVRGLVQKEGDGLFLCVNNAHSHVTLINICTNQAKDPEVYSVQGFPITFPTFLNAHHRDKSSIQHLTSYFSDAWFHSDLSHIEAVSQHIAAYRTSGNGGIIYIGLKLTKKDDGYDIQKNAIVLTVEQLSALKTQIQNFCKDQCPSCSAVEWTQKALPPDAKQRRDECLYTIFTSGPVKSPRQCRYVFRLVVFPSRELLHLCKESDIGFRKKNGSNALCYSVKEFISIMMENSFEKELRLLTSSKCECSNSLCISPAASSLELFNELPEESDTLEYKECATADPVTLAVEELRDYSIAWLNSGKEGKLRIGVSDKPPLATGVWLHDETQLRLVKSLEARFGGSLDREKFCFPSLTEYFNITKCQLSADSSRLLSQSTNVLIIWLKASKNCDEGFDYIRRQLYKQWMEKKNGALEDLFSGRKSILLPLDVSLLPNAQSISKENIALFPVAISHGLPLPLSKKGRKRMGDVVKGLTTLIDKDKSISQYIHSYEFVDLTTSKNVIHQDYCILDIDVVPPPTANKGIYLCKVPRFYKMISHGDNEHFGKIPAEMEFEDIVLHCSNFADQHRNGQFTDLLQPFDRPILITDCLNDQDCVKGFAHIPWSLIVNFDFEASSNVSATSFKSIEKPYCNNITYLSLSKDDPADLEAMSDASPVYCVHALGTSGEYQRDAELWLQDLAPPLTSYVERTCAIVKDKVKILIVWSSHEDRKDLVKYIASHVCLDIVRARRHNMEVNVVSPSLCILKTFAENDHSRRVKEFHIKLDRVSAILLTIPLQASATKEGPSRYQRVPGGSCVLQLDTCSSMMVNNLDYLYPGINDDLIPSNYDWGLAFFEGREKLVRWEHFQHGIVVERDVTKKLIQVIQNRLDNKYRKNREIHLVHYPGTGGSTVARHALWKLKDRYCCVIPFQMYKNLKKDIEQLSETSKNCVVVLWDTNLGIDFDTLKSMLKDIDVVFLCVERAFNPSGCQADVKIPENLTIAQLQEFCCQLSSNRNFNPKALKSLMICEERDKKGVPVFLVMLTGLETREFIQLPEYVNDRLTGLSDEQKKIMLQVAFAQLYTGKPLEMRAVETNDEQWQDTLPSSVQDLIRFGNHHGTYTFVHMRHHLIDELVIAKIEGIVKDSEKWGEWMASFVVPFIDHLRKEYPINPNTEGLINEFERVLRMLFHDKSSSMSIPDFVAKIKNKFYAIACMQKVRQKLPKLRVDRIRAHFLGDLARVYLIMDKENDLPTAKKIMKEALKVLPKESTLHHQMGQLYYNSMKLTKERWLHEKYDCALQLIQLAEKASKSFVKSRDCESSGRLDRWVPWKSDVQCRVECLSYICELMNCKYMNQLPQGLWEFEYIKRIEDETFTLLDTLHEYDPGFHHIWSSNLSNHLRTKPDCIQVIKTLFKEIHTDLISDKKHSAQHRINLAKQLQRISKMYRVQVYDSCRQVHTDDATQFTSMLYQIIVLQTDGYEENFFQLELLWNWSRFSAEPIKRTPMLGIIERYLHNVSNPELKAKCWLFQGVTMLLRRLSEKDLSVQPEDIVKSISDCCNYFKQNNSNWMQTEFIISNHTPEYNLLSFKDWNPHYRHLHLLINNSKALNIDYEENKHIKFVEFSGRILPGDSEVQYNGLRFSYNKKKAPQWWQESQSDVKFYIAVSSRDGLQAFPAYKLEDDKIPITDHRWPLHERTKGLIIQINGNNIHFGPPNKEKPYKRTAICTASWDLNWSPREGDLCEFEVRKDMNGGKFSFEAINVTLLEARK